MDERIVQRAGRMVGIQGRGRQLLAGGGVREGFWEVGVETECQ